MQAVDIFFRADCVDHRLLGYLVGHGKLHQNAVHLRVFVQCLNFVEKRVLRGVGGQAELQRVHADLFCRNAFIADVDLAGSIFADQHHRQPRRQIMGRLERRYARANLRAQIARNFFAINQICRHARLRR